MKTYLMREYTEEGKGPKLTAMTEEEFYSWLDKVGRNPERGEPMPKVAVYEVAEKCLIDWS